MKKQAVLSLSGGLDSSTLLLHLLANGYEVCALSFDYGQKHSVELERATQLVEYINGQFIVDDKAKTIEYPFYVKHQIIKIEGLSELLVSGLVNNNSMELKKGHYAHENALTSVVPNRNAIFASIIYAVALSVVKKTGENCIIALGTHMGDFDNKKQNGIYPDCSEEFKQAIEYAFKIGNWDSDKVDYYAPYNVTDKIGVLEDGVKCCDKLGLDYKEIYKRTNTSYDPIRLKVYYDLEDGNTEEVEEWFSDYKSGSSIERIISFVKLGLQDPLQYADEYGLASWDYVKTYALEIEKEFKETHPDF
jgi:7-cyano-7-deazaguanine synthase